ncbi:MAG: hypothetical protein JW384_00527 [Nitrosomonadaceae bacterium]|nr:hypothetical protein [Nitrosomonadaceae bacterium]
MVVPVPYSRTFIGEGVGQHRHIGDRNFGSCKQLPANAEGIVVKAEFHQIRCVLIYEITELDPVLRIHRLLPNYSFSAGPQSFEHGERHCPPQNNIPVLEHHFGIDLHKNSTIHS